MELEKTDLCLKIADRASGDRASGDIATGNYWGAFRQASPNHHVQVHEVCQNLPIEYHTY